MKCSFPSKVIFHERQSSMKGRLPPKVEKSSCIKDHLPSKVVLLVGGQFLSQHFKSKPPTKPRAFKKFLVGWGQVGWACIPILVLSFSLSQAEQKFFSEALGLLLLTLTDTAGNSHSKTWNKTTLSFFHGLILRVQKI